MDREAEKILLNYRDKKEKILGVFKDVFPEWEELPNGHRLLILYAKVKDFIFDEVKE